MKRGYSIWDPHVTKVFEPEKSLLGYFRDVAKTVTGKVTLSFIG